jgi:hypothetical protein
VVTSLRRRLRAAAVLVIALAAASTAHAALEVGEYIVFRFEGLFTPAPVVVRQEVLDRRGNRMVIDVHVERAGEQLHFVHIARDAPSPAPYQVEEAYQVVGGQRRRLDAASHLRQLRAWTEPALDAAPAFTHRSSVENHLGRCSADWHDGVWRGRKVSLGRYHCGLPWPQALGEVTDPVGGDRILEASVVERGTGGWVRLVCPPGTTHARRAGRAVIHEECRDADGKRHGPFLLRALTGGAVMASGQYLHGQREGKWIQNFQQESKPEPERDRVLDDFHEAWWECRYRGGELVPHWRPLHWTRLHLQVAAGGRGDLADLYPRAVLLGRVGWDVWYRPRPCERIDPAMGDQIRGALALTYDAQLVGGPTTLVHRLALQLHSPDLDEGDVFGPGWPLAWGLFASAGPVLSNGRVGFGGSIGIHGFWSAELHYQVLGAGAHSLALLVGISDPHLWIGPPRR